MSRRLTAADGTGKRIFGADMPGVLKDRSLREIDMPQRHGGHCIVARPAQKRERHQRTIAFLDVGFAGHGGQHIGELVPALGLRAFAPPWRFVRRCSMD